MSGHLGLREERRAGRLLARRLQRLFGVAQRRPPTAIGEVQRPWR